MSARHVALRQLQGVQGEEDAVLYDPVPAAEAGDAGLRAEASITSSARHGAHVSPACSHVVTVDLWAGASSSQRADTREVQAAGS